MTFYRWLKAERLVVSEQRQDRRLRLRAEVVAAATGRAEHPAVLPPLRSVRHTSVWLCFRRWISEGVRLKIQSASTWQEEEVVVEVRLGRHWVIVTRSTNTSNSQFLTIISIIKHSVSRYCTILIPLFIIYYTRTCTSFCSRFYEKLSAQFARSIM